MGNCPNCGDENIRVVHVTFECSKGHRYSEEVELPSAEEAPREPPKMNLSPAAHRKVELDVLTMPFGKYKGQRIEDLDSDYIRWCLENLERLSDRIKEEMENQLSLRAGRGVPRR